MNDFSEIENELRKLRPAQPSPILFERVGEALEDSSADIKERRSLVRRWGGLEAAHPWWSLGWGLAAAAAVVLLAAITMERQQNRGKEIAQISPTAQTAPLSNPGEASTSSAKFVPAGATRLVYDTRNEGLQFARGSGEPLRRFRYQTRETWQWRNPTTGASLRVSYPSEEVVLIPVSGQ
jgi:hypothetical protein